MSDIEKVNAVVVGYVRSTVLGRNKAPRQGRDVEQEAVIEILPEYADALDRIDGRDKLLVTCWLHLAPRDTLRVRPQGDLKKPLTGVFATRSPVRPNPLAVYTLDLLKVDGSRLLVRGIDAVDGTPVLDIKPFIHRLDE